MERNRQDSNVLKLYQFSFSFALFVLAERGSRVRGGQEIDTMKG